MNRRELIAGLGSIGTWPGVVRAQQGDRIRRDCVKEVVCPVARRRVATPMTRRPV